MIPHYTDDLGISKNNDDDMTDEPVAKVKKMQTDVDQQGVIGQEETGDKEDRRTSSRSKSEATAKTYVELKEVVSADKLGQENDKDEIQYIRRRSVHTKTSTATNQYKDFVCKKIQF